MVVMRNKANRGQHNGQGGGGIRHSRIVEEQLTGVHLRSQPYVTKVNVYQPVGPAPSAQAAPSPQGAAPSSLNPGAVGQRPNMLFRRKSEQPASIALMSGAAKRCSGEFDFMKNNRYFLRLKKLGTLFRLYYFFLSDT